jgi:hypothetical protein
VVDLLKQMPYANNFALAVQDIRDEQAQKDADAIPIPELVLPMSPAYTSMYEPMSPLQMQQGGGIQQPIMMMPQQPQMMMMPQPMMTMQPTQLTSATGANAAVLIEEQLHPPAVTESASVSMLDVAPEVKPAESSSGSSESSGSSDGKRVIKLS